MPSEPRIQLTPTTTRRAFFATAAAAWIALLAVVGLALVLVLRTPQRPVDVLNEINKYVGAEFFAHNFLLVWLAGDATQADKLASMIAMPGQPTLNKDPMTVVDITAVPPVLRTPAGNETEWALTLAATLIAPGQGTSTRSYFRVTFLEAGGAYRALMWPRPVNNTTRAVQIDSYYTYGIGLNTPLGTQVSSFMNAFYAADNSGSLGSYVSAEFTDTPLKGSPYTSITVKTITAAKNSPDTATAEPGTTIHVLVTAKASASQDTFHTIDAPLRLTLSNNKQWLVDGFDEPIHFGAVNYK